MEKEKISLVCFLLPLKRDKMSDTCPFPCLATPGLPACYPLTFMVSPDVSLGGGFSFAAVEILGPSFAPSTAFPLCQGLCAQRVSRRDISGWLCSFTTRQGQGAPATPPSPPKMSKHRSSRRGTRRFPGAPNPAESREALPTPQHPSPLRVTMGSSL